MSRARRHGLAVATPALAVVASLSVAGCSGDDGDVAVRPVVDQIAPAVEAVESELGTSPDYFEVNATAQFVNLFVAVDDASQVETYLFVDGELAPPTPPAAAEGATFVADALTFDPDTILTAVDEELPDSDVVVFTVVGGPDGAVRYTATVQSVEGGQLDVTLAADGAVLAVTPR